MEIVMSSSSSRYPAAEGPGSVSGAPNLPAGFTDTFTSRYVDTGELRQFAVIEGDGPPLLLMHGWPENWYAWRLLMPALARDSELLREAEERHRHYEPAAPKHHWSDWYAAYVVARRQGKTPDGAYHHAGVALEAARR